MYGKKTGTTPDGRKVGQPLAPGANPMHGRDENGCTRGALLIRSLNPLQRRMPGWSSRLHSLSFRQRLAATGSPVIERLVMILNGCLQGAHHLNVNVMNRETLIDAMDHPEKYPSLTIRVSGYAVNFINCHANSRESHLQEHSINQCEDNINAEFPRETHSHGSLF